MTEWIMANGRVTAEVVPGGTLPYKAEEPVDDGNVAVMIGSPFDSDYLVIEGGPDTVEELLRDALRKVQSTKPSDPIPVDYRPEGMEYWPPEGEPEFISSDYGQSWTPLCSTCGSLMEFTNGREPMWECTSEPIGHPRSIITADDWPNYDPDEEDA